MKQSNFIFCGIAFLLFGCSILKKTHSEKDTSSNVSKSNLSMTDTGYGGKLSTGKIISKEDFDWWKTTIINSIPQRKDTGKAITNVYPSTIIYEGGKGTKQTDATTIDSSWFKNQIKSLQSKVDSLGVSHEQVDTSKKTETDWKLYVLIGVIIYFILKDVLLTIKK